MQSNAPSLWCSNCAVCQCKAVKIIFPRIFRRQKLDYPLDVCYIVGQAAWRPMERFDYPLDISSLRRSGHVETHGKTRLPPRRLLIVSVRPLGNPRKDSTTPYTSAHSVGQTTWRPIESVVVAKCWFLGFVV